MCIVLNKMVSKYTPFSIQRDVIWTLPIFFSLKEMRNSIIHGSRISIVYLAMVLIEKFFVHIVVMGSAKAEMEKKI